jgi:hypothetical protein
VIQDLYGLPRERFVPARTALVKELRRGGDRAQADAVAALRKPSQAAWAVNQLVRTQKRDLTALFKAGDATQRAQAKLLAGRGTGAALREALDRERAAVAKLTRAARGLLSSEGHELSPTMLERVAGTLHAAALEPEARAQVKDGSLHRELRHVGLGGAGLTGEPSPRRRDGAQPSAPREAQADRTRAALRKRATEARRAAEHADRDVNAAEARRDSAAETLAAAESALAVAQRRAREAGTAHRRIERELGAD